MQLEERKSGVGVSDSRGLLSKFNSNKKIQSDGPTSITARTLDKHGPSLHNS